MTPAETPYEQVSSAASARLKQQQPPLGYITHSSGGARFATRTTDFKVRSNAQPKYQQSNSPSLNSTYPRYATINSGRVAKTSPAVTDLPKSRSYNSSRQNLNRGNDRSARQPTTPKYNEANPMLLAEIAEAPRETDHPKPPQEAATRQTNLAILRQRQVYQAKPIAKKVP